MQLDDQSREWFTYENPFLSLRVFPLAFERYDAVEFGAWHYHPAIEVIAVSEGTLTMETKERSYRLKAGDVWILGSNEVHRSLRQEPTQYIVLQFDVPRFFDSSTMPYLKAFSDSSVPLSQLNYIWEQNRTVREETFRLVRFIYDEMAHKRKGFELAISGAIKQFLFLVIRHDVSDMMGTKPSSELNRLRPALDYIESHLGENIVLADVSRLVNFNYHYFMKFFKKTMGMSFTEYIQLKRIRKAETLLLTEPLSVTEISGLVGFDNPAQFYKLFKRYNGNTPKAFIKQMNARSYGSSV
ncbi:AraC family transcriptional regulator [Paenibacillus sp. GYB003]|uniref:AraC family transcriptional regulator n=1 Tax=Paenibacillus sp. GYB003 TaxID=2994392 RepID=UPI002F96E2BB